MLKKSSMMKGRNIIVHIDVTDERHRASHLLCCLALDKDQFCMILS